MTVKVKICGVRSLAAAKAAVGDGADFLGFNFVPSSRRFIGPEKAKEIIDQTRDGVKIVGVFQNSDALEIIRIAQLLDLDYVQLHGEETPEFCNTLGLKIIKAFPIGGDTRENIKRYTVDYYMIDRRVQGEGKMVDTQIAIKLAKQFPVFYAGGLTPENVGHIVSTVKPFAVDVAGGVEVNGVEDIVKIKQFIRNAKGAMDGSSRSHRSLRTTSAIRKENQ